MVVASEYPLETQAKFPSAMVAIHNFICVYDLYDINSEVEKEVERRPLYSQPGDLGRGSISRKEREWATKWRDDITKVMWAQYVAYLDAREGITCS